jgi:methionyl-tRNA synthetase
MDEQPIEKKAEISYDDFAKLEIRVGTVLAAELIPDTDKLLKCTIDFGDFGQRTIVSGIATFRKPEEIIGKQLPYIVNLAPRMLRGVKSQGMLLAASPGGEGLALLIPDIAVPNGTKLK